MHCKNCTDRVKSALQKVKDVKDVSVSLKEGTAQVSLEASSDVNAEALAKAVADEGFAASYKDQDETKTIKAVQDKHSDKDCPEMTGDKKADCSKDGKADCCKGKSTKAKSTKGKSTKK
jgi:copper chaperone CopZ